MMELQLNLAIPAHDNFMKNDYGYDPKKIVSSETCWMENKSYIKTKRSFEKAFGKMKDSSQKLPLLVWSGQPNEEDDRKGQKKRTACINYKIDEEENQVVGWPPINSWRRKLFNEYHYIRLPRENNERVEEENSGETMNTLYVKVKMEGIPIVRKIDLRLYNSYQSLKDDLINLFARHQECKDGSHYTITYQDKEVHWLLAGDVPWQTFVESVQCLVSCRTFVESVQCLVSCRTFVESVQCLEILRSGG